MNVNFNLRNKNMRRLVSCYDYGGGGGGRGGGGGGGGGGLLVINVMNLMIFSYSFCLDVDSEWVI